MLRKLILVNIGVFVLIHLVRLFVFLGTGITPLADKINAWIYLTAAFPEYLYKPWSLFTYMFAHEGLLHILFNLLWLYFMGQLFVDFLGHAKLLQVYIWGGISGGLAYIILFNVLPVLSQSTFYGFPLLGASASVLAVVVAIATLIPNYEIRLFGILTLKLKYIVFFHVITSMIGVTGGNAGGSIAHLGGILFGYLYIKQIRHYTFLDKWSEAINRFFRKLMRNKKDERSIFKTYTVYSNKEDENSPDQDQVDAILDKINRSGYDSLTKQERELLFKASRGK